MQTITKQINRYRSVSTNFISFTGPVDQLQFVGFVKNDGVSKMKGLDVFSFETISYLSTSEKGFIHAVAYLNRQLYQVILK